MSDALLDLVNLRREFTTRRGTICAVDDVSLPIAQGDILCLVGESGSGKTTVARMAAGLLAPTSGTVSFEGRALNAMSKAEFKNFRHAVQIVHQDPYSSLNPVHTIGEALMAPLLRHRLARGRRGARDRAAELLHLVDLAPPENFLGKHPHQLSGGQRQRVSIARALTLDPPVIIAHGAVSMG